MATLTRTDVTVTFRTELRGDDAGNCFAVFIGEAFGPGPEWDALSFDPTCGHYSVSRGWYERCTRPATAAESQPVWDALLARGYDVTRATRMVWA